jgi:hypothetical protein
MNTKPQYARLAVIATAAVLALSLAGCAKSMVVPLNWKPSTDAAEMQARMQPVDLAGASVRFDKLEDTRKNRALIGEQPGKEETKTVSTGDDVGSFVARNLADSIAKLTPGSGLRIAEQDPAVVVSGEVVEFFVTEARDYEGTVRLHLLVKKSDGTQLYEVNTVGKASRLAFPSFSEEQYLKVLSDSVLQIARSLVEDAGFRKALKGG